jgi:predicted metal-dependent HD superfamily phosphohydrolase
MEENPEETHDVVSEDVLAQDNEARDAAAEAKKLSRRRTKTGCLSASKYPTWLIPC